MHLYESTINSSNLRALSRQKLSFKKNSTKSLLKNKIKNSDIFEFNVINKKDILSSNSRNDLEKKDILKYAKNRKIWI